MNSLQLAHGGAPEAGSGGVLPPDKQELATAQPEPRSGGKSAGSAASSPAAGGLPALKAFLLGLDRGADIGLDVLRHEMGATFNRNRLTFREEGIASFNTDQLIWAVLGMNDRANPSHPMVIGLLLSALIDGRMEIWQTGRDAGLVPADWAWVPRAEGFAGDDAELVRVLGTAGEVRQRCGAACLVAARRPSAIGPGTLALFRDPACANAYHRLLGIGLAGAQAAAVAAQELPALAERRDVLFAADVDATLAALIRASPDDPAPVLDRLAGAVGELAATAWAERCLHAGRPQRALELLKDVRLLSQAWPRAVVVAAIACLELGQHAQAAAYIGRIEDADRQLMLQARLAQATGDAGGELDALVSLRERQPADPAVFVQLLALLDRLGRSDLVRGLCFQGQEAFADDPVVGNLIRRHLAQPA